MTEQMTRKQRLVTAARGGQPDRVPVAPMVFPMLRKHFGGRSWEYELNAAKAYDFDPMIHLPCFDGSPVHNHIRFLCGNYNYEGRSYFEDVAPGVTIDLHIERLPESTIVRRNIKTPAGELTDAVRQPLITKKRWAASTIFDEIRGYWGPPEWIERLVKATEDLEKVQFLLTMPTPHELSRLRVIRDWIGEDGLLQVDCYSPLDEWADHGIGLENIRAAYDTDRRFFDAIVETFWGQTMKLTRAYLEAGAESLFASWQACGESAAWTPEVFREVFQPKLKEHVQLAHEFGAIYDYAEEFKIVNLLPMLIEADVDVVHNVAPPPQGDVVMAKVKAQFGGSICLRGNFDSEGAAEHGTPEQVDEAVRDLIMTAAPGGRYILACSDTITADWPDPNVRAFFDAARKYGDYEHLRVA